VDEKPGFCVCPPLLTAKGVREAPTRVRIVPTSASEPGSTEHAEVCEEEPVKCSISAS
jgi:hypothetical protein